MQRKPARSKRNRLLEALPPSEAAAVLQRAALVELTVEESIYRAGRAISYVYFPIDCALALVAQLEDGSETEVCSIGSEGVATPRVLLGFTELTQAALCVAPGHAWRVGADTFVELGGESPELRRLTLRYGAALLDIYMHYSACNRFHSALQRCARWLLLVRDRTGRDSVKVSHQFLARLLGMHRPAITLALGTLQRNGAIATTRGEITIADPEKLGEASCECYRNIARAFVHLYR